jgi:hypothetical protein
MKKNNNNHWFNCSNQLYDYLIYEEMIQDDSGLIFTFKGQLQQSKESSVFITCPSYSLSFNVSLIKNKHPISFTIIETSDYLKQTQYDSGGIIEETNNFKHFRINSTNAIIDIITREQPEISSTERYS